MITQARLKEVLAYDPSTGVFTRLAETSTRRKHGAPTGSTKCDAYGYRRICVDHKYYRAHRLAWLYMTGEFPKNQIDHIDGDGDNNAWSNLREASSFENSQNQCARRNSSSGLLGVTWDKHAKRWKAHIQVSGKHKSLGHFVDKEKAHEAYLAAKKMLHQFCPVPRDGDSRSLTTGTCR